MSAGYFDHRDLLYLDNLFWGLITASHILHKHSVFDAYGHISVRNPDRPSSFFLPHNCAPALLKSAHDLIEYNVEDGEPVEETARAQYAERFIHSEIYKRFPTVNAIAHSHSTDVLPYCINAVPLRSSIHTTGFLGAQVPVWDISSAYSSSDKQHDLLVKTATQGHALAAAFRPATSSGYIYSKMRAALPSQIGGGAGAEEAASMPEHAVVLMRGHGFTTVGDGIEAVVYQAIYTREAARVQTQGLVTQNAYFGEKVEGRVDVEGGGKIKSGAAKQEETLKYLSDREVAGTAQFNRDTLTRPWGLWVREVEVDPLYLMEVKKEDTKT